MSHSGHELGAVTGNLGSARPVTIHPNVHTQLPGLEVECKWSSQRAFPTCIPTWWIPQHRPATRPLQSSPSHQITRKIRLWLNWVRLYEIASGFKHKGVRVGNFERRPYKILWDHFNSRDWVEEGGNTAWKWGVICYENIKFSLSINSTY